MSDEQSSHDDATLRVALGEYDTGWHQPDASLKRASALVARAAAGGARLVVLPEMCTTGFTMEPEQWAESPGGPAYERLAGLARQHDVWIIAGTSVRSAEGFQNHAVAFDRTGGVAGTYAKQRLFSYGTEQDHYIPGSAPVTLNIEGVRVSPFVCYDLRFPELFRAVARTTDAIVVIANWPAARRAHWDALLLARAIENLSYVVGVNRTGVAGGLVYDGGSAAYDPWGTPSAVRAAIASPSVVDVSTAKVRETRAKYPFLSDLTPLDLAALSS